MIKVVIADDENKPRKAVVNMGNWNDLGLVYAEVTNGTELVEYVAKYRPEIVVTDLRMPGISGVELLQALRDYDEQIQVIVISGYDEFEYMKQAIVTKVVDYLMKPFSKEQLNSALSKAINEVESLRQRRLQTELAIQYYKEEAMTQLSEGRAFNMDNFRELTGIPLREELFYQVTMLRIANFTYLSKRFGSDHKLLSFEVTNVLNKLIEKRGIVFQSGGEDYECGMLLYRNSIDLDYTKTLLEEIVAQLRTSLNIGVFIGAGECYYGVSQIGDSYQEALLALKRSSFRQGGGIGLYRELNITSLTDTLLSDQGKKIDLLGVAVLNGNMGYIREWIKSCYTEIAALPMIQITSMTDLLMRIWRELEQLVGSEYIDIVDRPRLLKKAQEIEQQLQVELELTALRELCFSFISEVELITKRKQSYQDWEQGVIYDIRAYIENHFNEKVSLQDLADRFYISRESISRLYKKIFGTNLFNHIIQLKIDQAKLMLMDERHVKVREIVDMLGFTDESHFSKTFKKYTGQSPSAYRNKYTNFSI
ncbi:response regulator [Paenibacillus sp. NPDC058071]|uniref:response regulator n=1 Tax=Paenibacillus sp. NPDC058071 TaxID=3346326 RepID=UPI0036D8D9C5